MPRPIEKKVTILNPSPMPTPQPRMTEAKRKLAAQEQYKRELKQTLDSGQFNLPVARQRLTELSLPQPKPIYRSPKTCAEWTEEAIRKWCQSGGDASSASSTSVSNTPSTSTSTSSGSSTSSDTGQRSPISVVATFQYWEAPEYSEMLVFWSHGMQDGSYVESLDGQQIPPRNYAFTVPWDHALFNPSLSLNPPSKLQELVGVFEAHEAEFGCSAAPLLYVYPFTPEPPEIRLALQALSDGGARCDIVFFTGLSGCDALRFGDLLRAINTESNQPYQNRWKSYFLITCRSDAARGIGLGGAPAANADGLYSARAEKKYTV